MYTFDNTINALYQALPTSSFAELQEKLARLGFSLSAGAIRNVIKHLRKNAGLYGWTIPHVGNPPMYFSVVCEKDGTYHTDPAYRESLRNGSQAMSRRVVTETGNHAVMLRSVSTATHISREHRQTLTDLADDYEYLNKKSKQILRRVENGNGTNGTNGA